MRVWIHVVEVTTGSSYADDWQVQSYLFGSDAEAAQFAEEQRVALESISHFAMPHVRRWVKEVEVADDAIAAATSAEQQWQVRVLGQLAAAIADSNSAEIARLSARLRAPAPTAETLVDVYVVEECETAYGGYVDELHGKFSGGPRLALADRPLAINPPAELRDNLGRLRGLTRAQAAAVIAEYEEARDVEQLKQLDVRSAAINELLKSPMNKHAPCGVSGRCSVRECHWRSEECLRKLQGSDE
jgi:hypothetical protein